MHGECTPQKIFIKEAIIEAFSDKSKIDESKKLKILENLELYIPELTQVKVQKNVALQEGTEEKNDEIGDLIVFLYAIITHFYAVLFFKFLNFILTVEMFLLLPTCLVSAVLRNKLYQSYL